MILYLDSSAFLKLYVDEAESALVRDALKSCRAACIHLIGYAEMRAALGKALRFGRLAADEWPHQLTRLEADWSAIRVVGVTEVLVRRAGDLAQAHALRGYDSVHLAAAEAVWRSIPEADYRVAVFDARLADAARGMGMRVLD